MLVLWFGQFPDGSESIASQLFAVAMATVGLGAFAIVLALVEQVLPHLPHAQARECHLQKTLQGAYVQCNYILYNKQHNEA